MYAEAINQIDNQMVLMSIDTRETAFSTVNVDNVKVIGSNILASMSRKSVADYMFKKKDLAITMKARSTIKIDEVIPIELLIISVSNNH